jgi:hypothetical protein
MTNDLPGPIVLPAREGHRRTFDFRGPLAAPAHLPSLLDEKQRKKGSPIN